MVRLLVILQQIFYPDRTFCFSCVYPARSDTRRVLFLGVTSGNRAKRGYAPTEFWETPSTKIRAEGYSTAVL